MADLSIPGASSPDHLPSRPGRARSDAAHTRRHRGAAGFPLGWPDLGVAVLYLLAVVAAGSLAGKVLVDWAAPNAVTDYDVRLAQDLVADRTPQLDDWALIGSLLSSTVVKIVVTLIIAAIMAVVWRRWHEPVFVIGTLLFEAGAFVTITHIVKRARPPVEQLEGSTIGSSFPSGHVAAATVYAVVAMVLFWHFRSTLIRLVAAAVAVVLPLIVGAARLYQGMHHLSDVVAGVILGIVSIVICHSILLPPADAYPYFLRSGRSRSDHRASAIDTTTVDGRVPDNSVVDMRNRRVAP